MEGTLKDIQGSFWRRTSLSVGVLFGNLEKISLAWDFGRQVKENSVRGVPVSMGSRWWNLEGGFLLWEF